MLLTIEEIEALCERSPGLEAWVLPDGGSAGTADVRHFGGSTGEGAGILPGPTTAGED
jgi:hypothetical protein